MTLTTAEDKILKSIVVASENDPNNPEFPPENPKFPATPTYKIKVPGFRNVWLKDESKNPTGTHKDRMAWEMVVTYRDFLLAKKKGGFKHGLPRMSLITSGSAGIAVQCALRKYKLPSLKVLVDVHISKSILKDLKRIGCQVYTVDLSKKALGRHEILKLTKNSKGLDITSSEALGPTTRFYDWLSYEIINNSPNYCFIPFGTGNLYENVLNINKKEVSERPHDPRFKGKVRILKSCNFLGATTDNQESQADKLYSAHLPFVHFDEQWIEVYKASHFCGPKSNVFIVSESFLDKAMQLAKSQGIQAEPSGIAGLALMLQMADEIPKRKKILIVNTGRTRIPKT